MHNIKKNDLNNEEKNVEMSDRKQKLWCLITKMMIKIKWHRKQFLT